MDHAPILVHRISPTGGRRVVIRIRGVDTVLDIPYPDDLVLGNSEAIAWQGGQPHVYGEPDGR